jgi:hypothetical protein
MNDNADEYFVDQGMRAKAVLMQWNEQERRQDGLWDCLDFPSLPNDVQSQTAG